MSRPVRGPLPGARPEIPVLSVAMRSNTRRAAGFRHGHEFRDQTPATVAEG